MDKSGSPMGSGLIDSLVFATQGDVKIETKRDADGRGVYEIVTSWTEANGPPVLSIGQVGRPKDALSVKLD